VPRRHPLLVYTHTHLLSTFILYMTMATFSDDSAKDHVAQQVHCESVYICVYIPRAVYIRRKKKRIQ
jgi:hypothetical protein